MGFLQWIEDSALGIYVREDAWGFAIALSVHAVGMATVLGIVVVTNLRVLGHVREVPVLTYSSLFSIAWAGFAINLISGLMLYSSHAMEYTFQVVFILKLALLLVGGILMKILMDKVRQGAEQGVLKAISGLCLACWFGAVITGRLMAYF
jgi:hypothetical protein